MSELTQKKDLPVISHVTKRNDLPVISHVTKRNDFIEIKYTGFANEEIFDSNVEEDLKKLNPEAKVEKTIVVVGEGMVVPGFDKALENKELNKEYEISLSPKEGFGERDRNLMKTLPLKSFHEQKVDPKAGMLLTLDNSLVKIVAVSGARVTADFNNPMAGKNLRYKFIITRKVEDIKEKSETLFQLFFRLVPEFEVKENSVVVKGPKNFELFVNVYKEKFKELIGKDLVFEEISKEEFEKHLKQISEKHEHEHTHEHSHAREGHEH